MSRIARDAGLCYGCNVCQLVCSLHLTGSFWPERSGIQVSRNPRTGVVKWSIDKKCDLCRREGKPLCVSHCSYEALKHVADENQEGRERE